MPVPFTQADLTAFFSRVATSTSACWLWTGRLMPTGYGIHAGRAAHRIAFQWFVGPIPPNYHVHHRCEVRRCVNPAHLEALAPTAHAAETWNARRRQQPEASPALRRAPTHPGEVFEEEYRKPSGLSQAEAARQMGMSANRLNEIVAGLVRFWT